MYPQDCRYSKDHEWIKVEGDRGRVGITDYAQKQLGDVVFLELPEVGRSLKAGEQFGTVESVKAVSELFAPASGTVAEVNAVLAGAPSPPEKTRPIRVVLVAGAKDHGPGEHDYPAWLKAWGELLRAADNIEAVASEAAGAGTARYPEVARPRRHAGGR